MVRGWTKTNGHCYSRRFASKETGWWNQDRKRSWRMDSIQLSSILTIRKLPYLQVIHHPCFMVSVSHVFSSNLTQPVPMVISLLHSNWRFKINLTAYAVFKFRFFFARKHRLVNVVVGNNSFDKTVVVVALPGGVGTLDEVFEMLALIQLERIGSKLPIPFMLSNNDSFYSKLLDFLDDCENWGTVSKGELASLWKVCNSNSEALAYLEDF
jgi:predicted Rossmann-fold nucleotide-binding protein